MLMAILLIASLLTGCWLFSDEPKFISITVDPESMELTPSNTTVAVNPGYPSFEVIKSVTANYEDGSSALVDITDCNLSSENTEIATVNSKGLVTAIRTGETYILVKCTERNFPIKITQEDIVQIIVK